MKIKNLSILFGLVALCGQQIVYAMKIDVSEWHCRLHHAALYNEQSDILSLLQQAGTQASELVESERSPYGTILETTYVEGKPEIRQELIKYMRDAFIKERFDVHLKNLKDAQKNNSEEFPKAYYSFWDKVIVFDLHKNRPNICPLQEELLNVVEDAYNLSQSK